MILTADEFLKSKYWRKDVIKVTRKINKGLRKKLTGRVKWVEDVNGNVRKNTFAIFEPILTGEVKESSFSFVEDVMLNYHKNDWMSFRRELIFHGFEFHINE